MLSCALWLVKYLKLFLHITSFLCFWYFLSGSWVVVVSDWEEEGEQCDQLGNLLDFAQISHILRQFL